MSGVAVKIYPHVVVFPLWISRYSDSQSSINVDDEDEMDAGTVARYKCTPECIHTHKYVRTST